jgi:thymidylate synthase
MKNYLELMERILTEGVPKSDRTNVGTLSLFGPQLEFNLQEGFPLVTTKKIHLKSVIHELLWFIKGSTTLEYLHAHDVKIWDEWADADGKLGPIYGAQWRRWESMLINAIAAAEMKSASKTSHTHTIGGPCTRYELTSHDQLGDAIDLIKTDPSSRRIIVSAWNVGALANMALTPCHCLFQFYVVDNKLSCKMYQRSADYFLGVPFNIASYALLTHMVAQVTKTIPDKLIVSFGDVHLYSNHMEQVAVQLARESFPLPTLQLNSEITDIDSFTYEDITVQDYQYHPAIKAPIAV